MPGSPKVDLMRPVEMINEHLTAALCMDVYRRRRVRERERIGEQRPPPLALDGGRARWNFAEALQQQPAAALL